MRQSIEFFGACGDGLEASGVLACRAMRGRWQEISALAVALGLHAAVLVSLRVAMGDRVPGLRRTAPPRENASIEIDIGEVPGVEARAEGVHEVARADERQVRRSVTRTRTRLEPPPSTAELESVGPEAAAPALVPTAVASAEKPIDLGIGADGWQRWLNGPASGEAPVSAAPAVPKNRYQVFRAAPASTTGGLQEGLEESDRALALGLGPEGRILSASGKAAHASEAPETGVARFEVTVHRTGAVEVTLGAATAQREQWQQVAAHIANDLRSAPPRIPPPREGFKVVIEVVAELTLPNGTKVKSLKKPHFAAPLKFQSTDASVEQTNRENPTTVNPSADDLALKLDSPGVYVAQSGAVCSSSAGVGSIAPGYRLGAAVGPVLQGACDPSNVGAKAQRVVRTRVVAQSLF